MDNKKYEQLINLVINENEEQARELFHEIVVEKSREIFESIMAEEDDMGGQVGDLLDEIEAEESGMMEDEDDDFDFMGDEEVEMSDDDLADDSEDEEVEDAVIRIEDKLDRLMAEFEELMADGDHADMGDEDSEEDFDADMGDEEDFDADMGDEEDFDADEEEEEALAEAVQLKKVTVTHGDHGAQKRSPTTFNSGAAGMDSKPVKFSGASETVPTGPKGPSNAYTKGETHVKGAGNFKNSPGKDHFKDSGEAAPKPKHGDNGSNTKSPVAESRRPLRKR